MHLLSEGQVLEKAALVIFSLLCAPLETNKQTKIFLIQKTATKRKEDEA